ncbi:MAG: membrane-bound lytic murein transglycosylase MltF [Betaproteobacteria bacterium]|nr:membrane-bound lytic murein transglycosylase MltF [Betaproteobacteria bacterium]
MTASVPLRESGFYHQRPAQAQSRGRRTTQARAARHRPGRNRRIIALCLTATTLWLGGCERAPRGLAPFYHLGELVVVTRDTPLARQDEPGSDGGAARGFEHDLVQQLGEQLGVTVRFIVASSPAEVFARLNAGEAHMAAAMLVRRDDAPAVFSEPIQDLRLVAVQHGDRPAIDTLDKLDGCSVEALAGSPAVLALRALRPQRPRLQFAELADSDELRLLERVSQRRSDVAVVDSAHFALASRFFPDLQQALVLPGGAPQAWAFAPDADPLLVEYANAFIAQARADGTVARLADRYLASAAHRLSNIEINAFLERTQTTLPRFRRQFQRAQEVTGMDWRLLAALAYQESQWNPLATSPTGVRGFMMLTEETADRMKVSDRLDVQQSIRAGSAYLAELRDQLPREIREPDRTWIALAAYNLGPGHLNGALEIARGMGRDRRSWYELRQVLPLMSRPEVARRLKSGPARGGEAVALVENIRTFVDILGRFEAAHPQVKVATRHPPTRVAHAAQDGRRASEPQRATQGLDPERAVTGLQARRPSAPDG